MSATKILWGQLLFVSVVVLAFLWAATEWTSWRLAFQPQLGPPWFLIGGFPIYQPLAFFIWWFKFDAYAPRIFVEGGSIAASGGIAAMGVAITMSVWRAKENQHVTTYGSARWAEAREVRRAGLYFATFLYSPRHHFIHPDRNLASRVAALCSSSLTFVSPKTA